MYLMTLDLETTGLDVSNDEVIELGYAIYHIKNPAPIVMRSFLVYPKQQIPELITNITGITQDMIEKAGESPADVYLQFTKDIADYGVEWFVGQNILEFDYPMLKNNMNRMGLECPRMKMVDTKTDIKWSVKTKSNSLVYVCADHGFVNPFPHRALTDAMMCGILLYKYDIEKILEISSTPMVEIRADVGYDNRDSAKQLGYNWDGDRKIWVKKVREFYLSEEKSKASFQVLLLRKIG
jgi:DNA polymerase III subunit epsilon